MDFARASGAARRKAERAQSSQAGRERMGFKDGIECGAPLRSNAPVTAKSLFCMGSHAKSAGQNDHSFGVFSSSREKSVSCHPDFTGLLASNRYPWERMSDVTQLLDDVAKGSPDSLNQ